MEDIRFKQAQNLLEKAASRADGDIKLKVPQSGYIDVKRFVSKFGGYSRVIF